MSATQRLDRQGYQPLQVLRSRDLDETRRLVTDVFCAHRLQVRSGSSLDYQHSYLNTGRLSFSQISYGAEVNIRPDTLGFYLIQLPLSGQDRQRVDGQEVCSHHRFGSVHGPDVQLEMNWSSDCRKLAVDFIQAHPEQPITIETLAAVCGVSGRTLFAGFAKFMGMSPMRYLRDVRLERVRQDLLDPSQPRSVTQIATRWGFYQLGRMASDYRKRFAERPRDTLQRARDGLRAG